MFFSSSLIGDSAFDAAPNATTQTKTPLLICPAASKTCVWPPGFLRRSFCTLRLSRTASNYSTVFLQPIPLFCSVALLTLILTQFFAEHWTGVHRYTAVSQPRDSVWCEAFASGEKKEKKSHMRCCYAIFSFGEGYETLRYGPQSTQF